MIVLIILDGFGLRNEKRGNAVKSANMGFYNSMLRNHPHSMLKAGGESDGLENGTMGNSEVGHLNIGAGRIVCQSNTRITGAIKKGDFFRNKEILAAMKHAKEKNSALHLFGLVSDAGVHSRIKHLLALMKMAKMNGIKEVNIHAITDGRDTPPKEAMKYAELLEREIKNLKTGKISTVSGRYYAMDRDKRWKRTQRAFDAMAYARGSRKKSARQAILDSYKNGKSDEFIEPCIIKDYRGIGKNDCLIAFNFRADRMRQLCRLFERSRIRLATMTQYDKKQKPKHAFSQLRIKNFLGEVLSKNRIRQLRIAETEKYAHITYFFNAQIEKPMKYEDRILIKSNRKVATYDLAPGMRAHEITEKIVSSMKKGEYGLIIANFANPDMVGHTGNLKAAAKALEILDECLKKIIENGKKETIIITADHGNCEEMEGKNRTSHTLNPVPFMIISRKKYKLRNGIHADIAPTILDIMKIRKPKEMTGKSLIV